MKIGQTVTQDGWNVPVRCHRPAKIGSHEEYLDWAAERARKRGGRHDSR